MKSTLLNLDDLGVKELNSKECRTKIFYLAGRLSPSKVKYSLLIEGVGKSGTCLRGDS